MSGVIDNDFHPDDQLENDADQGHWGTKLGLATQSMPRTDHFIKDPKNWAGDENSSANYRKPVTTGSDFIP